ECRAPAVSARIRVCEEVLPAAIAFDRPAAAVEEVVNETDGLAIDQGNESERLEFTVGEKSLPGGLVNRLAHLALVEGEIGRPEPPPGRVIGIFQRTYDNLGHPLSPRHECQALEKVNVLLVLE